MTNAVKSLLVLVVAAALQLLLSGPAWALCAPSATGIFPASGTAGTTVTATVSGDGLAGATTTVFGDPGLGVVVQTATDTTVTLQLTIDANAVPGERIISLITAGGIVAVDFTVNPAGGPIVTGVAPVAIGTQGFQLDLTVSGENLASLGVANVTVSGNGVTPLAVTPALDGTSLALSLTVAADADIGTHAILFTSPLGGALLQLVIQRPAPVIAQISPAAGEIGTTVPLTITGSHLTGAALVITSGASGQGGVAITQVATPDDGTLTATLTIAATLSPESEPRLLIVTTESGQVTAEFHVVAAGVPTITNIRPGAGSPGETAAVTLRGLNFTGASVTTPSASLTLQNIVVVDDETITLDVVVAAGATVNTSHTITATVGTQSSNVSFRVVSANAPFIVAVRPPFGNRGDTVAIVLEGVHLSGIVPGTGVDLSGPKIIESNATALDDQTVRAILSIDPTASIGGRDVTVTTATGSVTKTSAFRVNIPGQIPIITDVTPSVVLPGTTTSITVTGSGLAGAGVSLGGAGATVTNIVVDPTGSSITFDLTLAADAAAENRPLIIVTENGSATCGILNTPTIEVGTAKIVKTGSVFEALTAGFRLFVYEFSINERFDAGPRTATVASPTAVLILTQLDAENVGRAVRDLPFAYMRVSGVTATNQIGTSTPVRLRR
jgi:hypothetical protein